MLHPSIKTYLTVAECGSFSKAAERLYISSTAVMKQISSLEERIGIQLIKRTNHGVELTAAGKSFYEDARYMTIYQEQALARARRAAELEKPLLRIGSSQLYPVSNAIALWDMVSSNLPGITLSIIPFEINGTDLDLEKLGIDYDMTYACFDRVGPGPSPLKNSNHFLQTGETMFSIALPKKHPLARKRMLGLSDLEGSELMIMKPGFSPINDRIRTKIEEEYPGIHLISISSAYNMKTFNECVRTGIPLLSLDIWENIHPMLVHVPLNIEESIPCGFIYSESSSQEAMRFLDEVRKVIE